MVDTSREVEHRYSLDVFSVVILRLVFIVSRLFAIALPLPRVATVRLSRYALPFLTTLVEWSGKDATKSMFSISRNMVAFSCCLVKAFLTQR